MSSASLWSEIERIVARCGLKLFDLEIPSHSSGTVRIYIERASSTASEAEHSASDARPSQSGVQLEDCARVSKAISADSVLNEILPEECTLEVSSPGINRRLRRPEHFRSAIGERVRLTIDAKLGGGEVKSLAILKGGTKTSISGVIVEYNDSPNGQMITVQPEGSSESVALPLSVLSHAQIDFKFS